MKRRMKENPEVDPLPVTNVLKQVNSEYPGILMLPTLWIVSLLLLAIVQIVKKYNFDIPIREIEAGIGSIFFFQCFQ